MGNNSARETIQSIVPIFQVQEVYPPGPLILDPEDEPLRMQLANIAAARLSPHLQIQCFVSIFKIEAWGYNFETNGFTDLPYLGRLTRHDLEVLHIHDKGLQRQILIAGMILNSEPTVQQLNSCRSIPKCQNAQDTIKALMEFRKKYQEAVPPSVYSIPQPTPYPYTAPIHSSITYPVASSMPFQSPTSPPPMTQPTNQPYPHPNPTVSYDTPLNQPYGSPPLNQSYYNAPVHTQYYETPGPLPSQPHTDNITQPESHYPIYQPVVIDRIQPTFHPVPATSPRSYPSDTPTVEPPKQQPIHEHDKKAEPAPKLFQMADPANETEPPKDESGNWLQKLFSPSKKEQPAPTVEEPATPEPTKPEPKNIFQETFGSDYESSGEEEEPEIQQRSVFMHSSGSQQRNILTFSDEEAISSLCDLGYERDEAEKAYLVSDRDEMAAMHWLADH